MHIAALRASLTTSGDASLQNALDLAAAALGSVPPYAQRELLLVFAGLSTCDPGAQKAGEALVWFCCWRVCVCVLGWGCSPLL